MRFGFITGRLFAPEGPGSGGGEGGGGAHPVAATPWAGVTEGAWKIGEAGKETEWWNGIAEEPVRNHIIAKGYKNPTELAMANYSLTQMQRNPGDFISIPGKDAKPEDWDGVYTKLGRPEKPEGYEFKFADGFKADEKMLTFGRTAFHEVGLNGGQAQKLADKWNDFVAQTTQENLEAAQKANTEGIAKLEGTWGTRLNEFKTAGDRVVKALGLSEETMNAIEGGIGAAPLIELLATIGMKSAEGGFVGGGGGGDPSDPANMTKEQANAKITELRGDPAFMKEYEDGKHPGHKAAVDRMNKLYART